MPTLRVVHFDQPEIGIEAQFALHPFLHVERRRPQQDRSELPVGRGIVNERLRRRTVEARGPVQMVDLEKHRAGFSRSAPAQDRVDALDRAAAKVRRDPEIGAQPRHYSTAIPD